MADAGTERPMLLLTRPAEEAASLGEALAARGYACLNEPLLIIEPLAGVTLDLTGVQAICVTSRNGVRALAAATVERRLPLLAVGDSTAALARAAGFAVVSSAAGDVAALGALAASTCRPGDGPLLHVSGRAAAGDLVLDLTARGFACRRVALYEARAAEALSPAAALALSQGRLSGAVFFSPRTAATFVRLVEAAALAAACGGLVAYCLSPAVARLAARVPWRRIAVAARPNQAALLALLSDRGEKA